MPTAKDIFKSKWQRAGDLSAPALRTIDRVEMQQIGRGNDLATKPVVYFREPGAQPLVLNATNFRAIAAIASEENCDLWDGVRVVIFPTAVEYGGAQVAGIRVRPPRTGAVPAARPAPPRTVASAPDDSEIPF
jgi:hypothetical protein